MGKTTQMVGRPRFISRPVSRTRLKRDAGLKSHNIKIKKIKAKILAALMTMDLEYK